MAPDKGSREQAHPFDASRNNHNDKLGHVRVCETIENRHATEPYLDTRPMLTPQKSKLAHHFRVKGLQARKIHRHKRSTDIKDPFG